MIQQANETLINILMDQPVTIESDYNIEYDSSKEIEVTGITILQQIQFNNYTIIITTYGQILLYDSEYNLLLRDYAYLSGEQLQIQTMCVDEEGSFYAIGKGVTDSKFVLLYLNNITQKTAAGEYQIIIKQDYDIDQMLLDIVSAIGGFTYVPTGGIRMVKSPMDSRFLFIFDGIVKNYSGQYPHNKNVYLVYYKVNFGTGGNDYEYRAAKIGSLDTFDTKSIYAAWTESNVNVSFVGVNRNQSTTLGNMVYYSCKVNFSSGSSISQTSLINITNTRLFYNGTCAEIWDTDNLCIGYQVINGTETTIRIAEYNGSTLKTIQEFSGKDDTKNLVCFIKVGEQIFTQAKYLTSNDTWSWNAFHLTRPELVQEGAAQYTNLFNNSMLSTEPNGVLLGTKTFNTYNLLINTARIIFIYRDTGFNSGQTYYGDFYLQSLTSHDTSLYAPTTLSAYPEKTIFNRDLYDKTLIGNSVNSVTQVPYNYLNNVLIIKEKLYANTNSTIDIDTKEITKNQYEELYINNIDSYKVYDNNNGSIYNQKSSLKVAEEIFSGFEDNYKITNYRINYTDNTHEDKPIDTKNIVDNIATIDLFIYPLKEVKNIEIYDSNFTTPFVTINLNIETNKLYKIRQYIKVE